MSSKLQVPRISDAIAATLERRILEGSLKPGDRLIVEGLQRLRPGVPVREAASATTKEAAPPVPAPQSETKQK